MFHFPPNLKSKPTIIVWEVKDLGVIIVGFMIAFYFLLSRRFVLPSAFVTTYAIMTIRINEYTIMNGVINALNFFILEPQEYDWDNEESLPKEKTVKPKKKPKTRKKKPKPSNVDLAVKKKDREKMIWIGFAAAALFLTTLAGGIMFYMEKRAEAADQLLNELNILFANTDFIEYGKDPVDLRSLVIDANGQVDSDPKSIDSSKLDSYVVHFTVSGITDYGEEVTKTYQKTIEVKDTQTPIIELGSETVILSVDQEYDILSNIKSIYDPVDGELVRSETLDLGTYMITGSADTHKEGTYSITVDACDLNGKLSTEIFFVEVRK